METAPLVGREACTADDDVILIRDTLLLVGVWRYDGRESWEQVRCSISRAEALSLGVHPLSVEWVFASLPE